ncbi:MAG: formylmethanofuran dehydrogenase subunit E [Nitrospirae bacterium]|nr:MAG: formylmethanofuran dehydrogenase subunit E [Nitrospirota bacterium]
MTGVQENIEDMDFDSLLDESAKIHGHLCPGQVLGVRMSMLGLKKICIKEPKGKDRKNIIVFVEMDRCATDAVQSVTGCSLGHRTMKFMDYGKMAATFLNLKTGRAVRVIAREDSREKAKEYFPEIENKYTAQLEAYKIMPDEELFNMMDVNISIRPEDMPGRPLSRAKCENCGEHVQDMREIHREGEALCKPCADGGYYMPGTDFLLPRAVQKSHNGLKIKSKLWIEVEGEPVFGRGRRFLLEAIDKHGSLNQAAKEISISYKRAWSYIKAMEERLGVSLVERKTGGKNGGGATLTNEAKEFLKKYEALENGIKEIVDEKFKRIFER